MIYLNERRESLGGSVPRRNIEPVTMKVPRLVDYEKTMAKLVSQGPGKEMSTTMGFVRLLTDLLRDKQIGKQIVPIVPDESRTFGMEGLFRQIGIYAHMGQLYEPVDSGQNCLLQRSPGRPDSGRRDHRGGLDVVVQRRRHGLQLARGEHDSDVHLLLDVRLPTDRRLDLGGRRHAGEGFYVGRHGGTHHTQRRRPPAPRRAQPRQRDGLSHRAGLRPGLRLRNGRDHLRRLEADVRRQRNGHLLHHAGKRNLPPCPRCPPAAEEGIIEGMYKVASVEAKGPRVQLFGSGPILRETLRASQILADNYGVASDVWSVTSYTQLRRDAQECERWNMLNPDKQPRRSYLEEQLDGIEGPTIAASDHIRALAEQVSPWVPGDMFVLGTDGMGRSESREALRRHFEVDAECITVATLYQLSKRGKLETDRVAQAVRDLGIDPDKPSALYA